MDQELSTTFEGLKDEIVQFAKGAHGKILEQDERLIQIEQKLSHSTVDANGDSETKSLGAQFVEHEQVKTFLAAGLSRSGRVPVGSFFEKSTIFSGSGTTNPLPQRVPGIAVGRPRLRVRDALTVVPATSNVIEYAKLVLSSSTNAAQPQGYSTSPYQGEGSIKAESAMQFVLASMPVSTLAHWIPAAKQILDDNLVLQSFIDTQMKFWLAQYEESQLLNGTGGSGELDGLVNQATAYDTGLNVANDTKVDTVRHISTQLELAGYQATTSVLNPKDAALIDLIKTAVASGGQYVVGEPGSAGTLWNINVVSSPSMTTTKFVAFDGSRVFLYDRMSAILEASREHSDFFTRNLVALLCELREALVVPDPLAVVAGTFPS